MKIMRSFEPYFTDVFIDILLILVGKYVYNNYKDNYTVFYIFVFLFAVIKFGLAFLDSKGKNIVELVFNFFITILLGLFELAMLVTTLIKFQGLNNFTEYLKFSFIPLGMICMALIARYLRKKSNSNTILPTFFLLLFVIVFSTILSFVDTSQSTMISAVTAIASMLLTKETLEDVFNIKLNEVRKRQISLLKLSLMVIIPIIYISSIIVTYPENTEKDCYNTLLTGLYRFLVLEISFSMFLLLIYFKKIRQNLQTFLGLSSELKYLYGNWNMVSVNEFTNNDIIVRTFLLNIDGNRIKYSGKIFTVDEKYTLYNDEQEKIGTIEKINDDRINIKLGDAETKIRLVKMGSSEYKEFNQYNKMEGEKFYNIQVLEPITNTKLDVTIFTHQKNHTFFVEANSKTGYKYELKNGNFTQCKNIDTIDLNELLYLGLSESSTFN
ncbi:hypothetical protein [Streptococcus constellatus]|uniref:hypothetical protein n=1 Tax=Streptococcus constellatus TaxID=76860 RepID=UPI00189B20DF|nr:hypothetical protein [Streptococcus constellatus]